MRTLVILALLVGACARLPHLPPSPRDRWDIAATTVALSVSCGDPDDFWSHKSRATGVIVSERHVLTAAHAVSCPGLATVRVQVAGRFHRMVVERDDALFGSGRDVARLEIASADTFGIGAYPPTLVPDYWEGEAHAFFLRGILIGEQGYPDVERVRYETGFGWIVGNTLYQVEAIPGDSGSPVYNLDGDLVGIVTRAGRGYSRVERIGPYWLEGT